MTATIRGRLRTSVVAIALLTTSVSGLLLPVSSPAAAHGPRAEVLDLLFELRVKAERSSGFDTARFGRWSDADDDGCRTNREALAAAAKGPAPATCSLHNLRWADYFTGAKVDNHRKVTADHLVPLKEAWQSGARRWSAAQRHAFKNDLGVPSSIVAVTTEAKRARGVREPHKWLPPRTGRSCAYVVQWVAVKWRWQLAVNNAEQQALIDELIRCGRPEIRLPESAVMHPPVPGPDPQPLPPPAPPTPVRYDTCADLATAGLGPYVRGRDAEYAWYRDNDGDGIACENAEALGIQDARDWRTSLYTRTSEPWFIAAVRPAPDLASAERLHAAVSALDGTELWRGTSTRDSLGVSTLAAQVAVGILADGQEYTVQTWTSSADTASGPIPADALTMSFTLDTTPPPAPHIDGYEGNWSVRSAAPDVFEFRYAVNSGSPITPVRALPDQDTLITALSPSSGPGWITVIAVDRAGWESNQSERSYG